MITLAEHRIIQTKEIRDMIKRLIKFVGFIPVLLITFPIEVITYTIRWLLTGKSFPDVPIIARFIFEW